MDAELGSTAGEPVTFVLMKLEDAKKTGEAVDDCDELGEEGELGALGEEGEGEVVVELGELMEEAPLFAPQEQAAATSTIRNSNTHFWRTGFLAC